MAGKLAGYSIKELMKVAQSAFQMFHLLTCIIGTNLMVEEVSMTEGLCYDFEKAARSRRLVSSFMCTNAKFGLVVVIYQAERKFRGFFVVQQQHKVMNGCPVLKSSAIWGW